MRENNLYVNRKYFYFFLAINTSLFEKCTQQIVRRVFDTRDAKNKYMERGKRTHKKEFSFFSRI